MQPISQPVPIESLETAVKFDRETAFQLYATFCGDCTKTAHALGVRAVDVLRIADECGWNDQLKDLLALKNSARPGDIERALNRAFNYVQAHRMRMVIERIITRLYNCTAEELDEHIFTDASFLGGKRKVSDEAQASPKRLNTRAIADLASAMEKAQAMSYQSLNDTTQERVKRREDSTSGETSALAIHERIAAAMSKVRADNTPRAMLFDAQLERAHAITKEHVTPLNPLDDDNH